MRLAVYKILENANEIKNKQEKIDYLRANFNTTVGLILQYAYDPKIKWAIPEGKVPYKKSQFDETAMLYNESRRLYLFLEGGNPNLKASRRELLFIQLMESIHEKDADLIESVKDKKLPYKSLTKALIMEALPGLLPDEEKK